MWRISAFLVKKIGKAGKKKTGKRNNQISNA
jgi:hypothetical protein